MALATEGATNSVEAVAFSFLTNEEILKSSRVKVTDAILVDNLGAPVPGGLYDPAFGPFVDRFPCKTCGLPKDHCSGHFGHIELVTTLYNPLMFTFLSNILKKTCFSCHHFKASRNEVERSVSQLKLIMEGNISKAKNLDGITLDGTLDSGGGDVDDENQCSRPEQPVENWTSIQFSEAMSVLRTFLQKDYNKCRNCGNISPKITKPIFGWFHLVTYLFLSLLESTFRNYNLLKNLRDISSFC